MYLQIPQTIAIPLQTVATFAAPDPWNGGTPAQWTLSVYRMTAENNRGLYVAYSAEKQLESATGQNLDREDTLGIRSSADGLFHILPVALVRLWQSGRVANAALPAVIAALEPRLARRDFYDPAAAQPWRRYLVYGVAAVGAVFAAVGIRLAIGNVRTGLAAALGPGMWLAFAALYWIVAAALLWRISRRQRQLREQEAQIAELLQGR